MTFDPHPEQFLRPDNAPPLLTPMGESLCLLAGTGMDAVLVLKFDETLARLSPYEFVRQVLVEGLKCAACTRAEISASATAPRPELRNSRFSAPNSAFT